MVEGSSNNPVTVHGTTEENGTTEGAVEVTVLLRREVLEALSAVAASQGETEPSVLQKAILVYSELVKWRDSGISFYVSGDLQGAKTSADSPVSAGSSTESSSALWPRRTKPQMRRFAIR
jgi:hypothetical protein